MSGVLRPSCRRLRTMNDIPVAASPFERDLGRATALLEKTLFFIGGAPRSGTTWVQEILDAHPEISCRSEALIQKAFQGPIDMMLDQHRADLTTKNQTIFRGKPGYPTPLAGEADLLLGLATLMTLARQAPGPEVRAIGEKTPENVFFFPRLKGIFPKAKLILVVRDPRDMIASAWHFFGKARYADPQPSDLMAFVRTILPAIDGGLRQTVRAAQAYPDDAHVVAYEALIDAPLPTVQALLSHLGIASHETAAAACIDAARFPERRGGEAERQEESGSFLRLGVKGSWGATLSPDHAHEILERLDWSFDHFGWPR